MRFCFRPDVVRLDAVQDVRWLGSSDSSTNCFSNFYGRLIIYGKKQLQIGLAVGINLIVIYTVCVVYLRTSYIKHVPSESNASSCGCLQRVPLTKQAEQPVISLEKQYTSYCNNSPY